MGSIIFRTASNFLLMITLSFSIWVLFRGHNAPGGGFIGGLIASSGFALYLLANGIKDFKKIIKIKLELMMSFGFFLLLISGLIGAIKKQVFLSSEWIKINFLNIHIGSPILFDMGVYLLVLSSVLIIMLVLEEAA